LENWGLILYKYVYEPFQGYLLNLKRGAKKKNADSGVHKLWKNLQEVGGQAVCLAGPKSSWS